MGIPILAIDDDKLFSKNLEKAWSEQGFTIERIDSLAVAIALVERHPYVFVGINGDGINYLQELMHLREATLLPIFIAVDSRKYTVSAEIEALENGADSLTIWSDSASKNVQNALAKINRINQREHQEKISRTKKGKAINIVSSVGIVLSSDYRAVIVNGHNVKLTRKEFEILFVLMRNLGKVLTHSQIVRLVWGDEYDDDPSAILRPHISRIRAKINCDGHNRIQSENEVGYRFVKK